MRCSCCDALLTTEETSIKLASDGSYADMCKVCLDAADILYTTKRPFYEDEVVDDEEYIEPEDFFGEEYWNER